jgi:hypothetical protein
MDFPKPDFSTKSHLMLKFTAVEDDRYVDTLLVRCEPDESFTTVDRTYYDRPLTRQHLLRYACSMIKEHDPGSFAVMSGGVPLQVSAQTIREIVNGTKTWRDLFIGKYTDSTVGE